jgi:ATP-dependent DNA helicase RecG
MLTVSELESLLGDLESDRVERKESVSDNNRIKQAICAFANDLPDHQQPEVVFIGVRDNGTCANLPITDQLLLTLANMRSDGNIQPFPIMTVQKKLLDGCEVAVLEVQPAYNPPVRFNGRVWIRVGPRRATATADEERRLTEKRRVGDVSFDQQAMRGASLDDLDTDLFQRDYLPAAVSPEVLAENQRTLGQQLSSLRFLTRDGIPNAAAILTLGRDPRQWVPGAYVQFVRLDGTELTDAIRNQREISGPLPEAMRELDELLDVNISVSSDIISGATEIRRPDYPIVALQQLSRNAMLHRTYEGTNAPSRIYWFLDRIEIHSPGGPYGQVNEGNFGRPGVTDYRNPLLAEAMKTLGFVQRFGVGIQLARKELSKNGNPDVEFLVEPTAIVATVRRRP